MSRKNESKKPKKQGPIRFEAILPFLIFTAAVWAYFFFFFDSHLKRGLEFVGTQINGAEVNIDRIRTSFWKAQLDIKKIQVTDKDQPEKNKLQIGTIRWKVLWDALLRGKLVIEDASCLEVALGAPRQRPGRVLPPPPPGSKSLTDKLKDEALAKAQEEFSQNVLGDVAALLGGVDPEQQLRNIESQLQSSLKIKELDSELKVKEKQWKERFERLPQAKDIESVQDKLKTVKLDGFNNPGEVQQAIQQIDTILKEVDSKIKETQSTSQALGTDVNTYQNTLKELEKMVQQDIRDLENRLKIPKLDVQNLSKALFGSLFLGRVKQAEYYMSQAREYMPPEKTAEEKAKHAPPKPRERATGRNYKFGRPNSYPLFWLKQMQLGSEATAGADWSGNLLGTLTDVTDDPPTLGRPTRAEFSGEFPAQNLMGIKGEVFIDHTTAEPVERASLQVARFNVKGQRLVQSDDVQLGFQKAVGSTVLLAELRGPQLKIDSKSTFQEVDYKVEAKQPILDSILKGVVGDLSKVTLDASVSGTWTDLKFNLSSNLGHQLARGFEKQIQLKINEAKAKIKALVDEKIGKEKERLVAEFKKIQTQLTDLLKGKEQEVNNLRTSIEQAKSEAIKNQEKKLESEGKKVLEDLKKKFKF